MNRRRWWTAVAAALLALGAAPALHAQDGRPIRLVVGFPAGGSADAVARLVAEQLRTQLKTTVVVDNKPGAAGRIALNEVRRAPPDGHTLLLSPSGPFVVFPWVYRKLDYDPVKDFTPIARVATFDFALTTGPAVPAGDLKALLTWLKTHPQQANYASPGAGTLPHFAGLLVARATDVPLSHVAYKGGAPAMADLMGGQVPLMIDTPVETLAQHRSGKLHIVAVTGERRLASLPQVPTLKESGYDVTADGFFAVYGPTGLPPAVVTRLDRAMAEVLRRRDTVDQLGALGLSPAYGGPFELAKVQGEHLRRWEVPVKASGFTAE